MKVFAKNFKRFIKTYVGGQFSEAADTTVLQQAEAVYRAALTSLSTQSLVFMGRSGAGKTCNFKQSLEYLVDTTQNEADQVFTSKSAVKS